MHLAPNSSGKAPSGTWLLISGDCPWNKGIKPKSTWNSMASNQAIQKVINRWA